MKKIYHLFAFVAAAFALASCHPLDNTYKKLDDNPVPAKPSTITYTLAAADYKLLPSTTNPYKNGSFASNDEANQFVPTILNLKYPLAGDGSNANITYSISTPTSQIKVADSLFKDVAYTLTDADYNNSFHDFSDSQVLSWLKIKYPTPAVNQLALITFTYFLNGATSTQTFSFLYLSGAWKKIHTITPAQYTSIGKGGTFNDFSSSDAANLVSYFNTFLKADPSISATAKVGDVQYVSFKYFAGSNYQRVLALQFDGNNWVTLSVGTTGTATFVKAKGAWAGDPTVYYKLTLADAGIIAAYQGLSAAATTDLRTNLAKFGDFESGWTTADIQLGIIQVLLHDFPMPKVNVNYKVTYEAYSGGDKDVVLTFSYDGSKWSPVQ
jgi:hypothetical protein